MQQLQALLLKEFKQIRRNPVIIRLMLAMPVIQLLIMPLAADYEVKEIQLAMVDHDHSTFSAKVTQKLISSGYFKLIGVMPDIQSAEQSMDKGNTDLIVEIPSKMEKNLIRENEATLNLKADAVNIVKAGLGMSYAIQAIQLVNQEIRQEFYPDMRKVPIKQIDLRILPRFNPNFNYKWFIAPGVLGLLMMMIGAMMSALNMVREKEIGTQEQMNVTPMNRAYFLLAKLIPFWVLGLVILTIGLLEMYLVFGIFAKGSYLTIYLFTMVFLVAALGIGQLLATFSDNQQQATLFAFFFMMVFVLMSGLFTPVESMPGWAQWIAFFNPISHYIEVIRGVVLKSSTFADLMPKFWILLAFALTFNILALLNFSKRTA